MVSISTKSPKLRCYPDGRRELLQDIQLTYAGMQWTLREGISGDASSIPRIFWRVCGSPTTGPNLLAGIVHDDLYTTHIFDRATCDRIFYELLILLGKPRIIAWLMYKAVSRFGKSHW